MQKLSSYIHYRCRDSFAALSQYEQSTIDIVDTGAKRAVYLAFVPSYKREMIKGPEPPSSTTSQQISCVSQFTRFLEVIVAVSLTNCENAAAYHSAPPGRNMPVPDSRATLSREGSWWLKSSFTVTFPSQSTCQDPGDRAVMMR